ncbi:MAG: DUF3179 domain-containing protein, partial [Lewinella sp.]|nr:DUF3179 domain-containing protein [Lewinella sp.]
MSTILRYAAALTGLGLLLNFPVLAQRAIFVQETAAGADFRMENLAIPSYDIVPGGPGKDGIPAIDAPQFTDARHDQWMNDEDIVIGLVHNGVAKAYPLRILNYHEVVNDEFDGEAVAVTYSPLCGSAMAFATDKGDYERWQLAVSGLLYNNNPLFFDRKTESLWSQLSAEAVSGPVAGASLDQLPVLRTTWAEWRAQHPETLLLSRETGFHRNYEVDAYEYYVETDRLMFPVNHIDKRLPVKTLVLGVEVDGVFKAYPYATLPRNAAHTTEDIVNG